MENNDKSFVIENNQKIHSLETANNSIFSNETLKNEIFAFIRRSQDNGASLFASMDDAFYLGKSLIFLNDFLGNTLSIGEYTADILTFVANARNPDGGYANWKHGRSSMESTVQAIDLLKTLNHPLSNAEINKTLDFIKSLKTAEHGYFPLPKWDAPDMSSTYRALWIKNVFRTWDPSIPVEDENLTVSYILGNLIEPTTINGPAGYAEITNTTPELLASYYAMASFQLLNLSNPHYINVAWFLDTLSDFTTGGVSGKIGYLPKTGFTTTGLELYLLLNDTRYDPSNYPRSLNFKFPDKALEYIKATKISGEGFSASERDSTAGLSSTYFALNALQMLNKLNILNTSQIDLSGVFDFLTIGNQPTYGLGNFPGDVPNLQYTSEGILTYLLLDGRNYLENLTGLKNFIGETYDKSGGFGFTPGSKPLVKYTYSAILALRALNDPLTKIADIKNYILSAQSFLGGFGSGSNAQLSYLTHTFWASSSLFFLGEFYNKDNINFDKQLLVQFINSVKNGDGSFSNSPNSGATLASTYRALYVMDLLNNSLITDPSYRNLMNSTLRKYLTNSGGFLSNLNKTVPDIIDTYYGVMIAELLGINLNMTKIKEFTLSLYNADGGFGLRPKFSSRISSTYYALMILKYFDNKDQNKEISFRKVFLEDKFAPIIVSGFVPLVEANKSIIGQYRTAARVNDPEGGLEKVWLDITWYINKSLVLKSNITGRKDVIDQNKYEFLLSQDTYNKNGYIEFKISALDKSGNIAITESFVLLTVDIDAKIPPKTIDILGIIKLLIVPMILIAAFGEGMNNYKKNKKDKREKVKMKIPLNQAGGSPKRFDFTMFYILIVITLISLTTRLFISQAVPILQKSTFLFQFIIGAFVILFFSYIVGLKSYGFFSPMILVISWLNLGPFWGFMMFFVIFAYGFIIRYLISDYNLAHGFRIGIVMIAMIVFTGLLEVIGETFRISFLTANILLPIIIVPGYIDRYVIEVEEHSYLDANIRLFNTILIVFFSWIFMSFQPLVTFIVFNPESWVLFMALLIVFGKNAKYSRIDKKRFFDLFAEREDPLTILVRNRDYISRYNQKLLFQKVNKFNLKEQFEEWRVPSPELLAIINREAELSNLMKRVVNEEKFAKGFVIKPSQSFGGRGILVVLNRNDQGNFIIGKEEYHPVAIEEHIRSIIRGEFLTSNTGSDTDIVIIEALIHCYDKLQEIAVGLPDIRVIVFRGIPVMAMARLPTKESGGKANLKQGAIGAGINLGSGKFFKAQYKGNSIQVHPDTKNKIVGFSFKPKLWKEILAVACLAQKSTGLGYAGVDLVIDNDKKLYVLEVNKRPGLEIQNINGDSLLHRFKIIENLDVEAYDASPLKSTQMGLDLLKQYQIISGVGTD